MSTLACFRAIVAWTWPLCGWLCGGADIPNSGGYRGPARNGVFSDTGLLQSWPEGGPELVWRLGNLGNGWGAVCVAGDTVYAVGGGSQGRLFAFTLEGALKWRTTYGREFSVRYLGSRSTPTVVGARVLVTSGLGVVYCLDAPSGAVQWSVDTVERFKSKVPGWGYNLTPLVVDDKVILPIRRGDATMVALEVATGKTVWANAPSEYAIGDTSPVLVEWRGHRLVVNNLWNGLVALDPATGKIIWKREGEGKAGTSLTPVFNEGYLLLDWDKQTVMFKPRDDGTGFDELWQIPRIFSTGQAVILDGKVFAFGEMSIPSETGGARGPSRKSPAYLCYEAATGKLLAAKPANGKPGSVVAADGMVYWLEDGPILSLAKVTPQGFEMVSSFRPDYGDKELWIHPVIAQGRLFFRSDCAQGGNQATAAGKLAVYDLRAETAAALRARRQRIQDLTARLRSASATERVQAADALRDLGHQARLAVPALVPALSDPEVAVRRAASAALGEIGTEAVPALLAALKDSALWQEGLAASALVKATPGATNLLAALLDAAQAEPAAREPIAGLLPRIGPPAVEALNRLLTGPDRRLKSWTVGVLKGFGPSAQTAVTNLVTILQTEDQWFRANAARTLGTIGPAAAPAVPALTERLKDDYNEARAAAATALGLIGVKSAEVREALRQAARDPDDQVVTAARAALARLGN